MHTIINDFDTRVNEINNYFKLLDSIINKDASIYYPNNITHKYKKFDDELIKVLKANSFLLIYNLIESSMKLSISEIYDSITLKTKKYDQVKMEIKKVWLLENYKNFNGKGIEFLYNTINNLADDIIDIKFKHQKVISGNIDGRKIKEFSKYLGFSSLTHHKAKDGEKLFQVKKQRNNLAHGLISFADCGRQYTYDDLNIIKNETIIYLRGIIKNIQKYIENENFTI